MFACHSHLETLEDRPRGLKLLLQRHRDAAPAFSRRLAGLDGTATRAEAPGRVAVEPFQHQPSIPIPGYGFDQRLQLRLRRLNRLQVEISLSRQPARVLLTESLHLLLVLCQPRFGLDHLRLEERVGSVCEPSSLPRVLLDEEVAKRRGHTERQRQASVREPHGKRIGGRRYASGGLTSCTTMAAAHLLDDVLHRVAWCAPQGIGQDS